MRKVVQFRSFLRTWLPRRQSLVGADTSTRRVSLNPNTREPKKEISWLRTHGTFPLRSHLLAFLGILLLSRPLLLATDHLPWSFFFLTSPSCGDRPPSLVFLFSHVPFLRRQTTFLGLLLFFLTSPYIFGDRSALAELNGFHVRDLVCSSLEKNLRFLDLSDS